MRFFLSSFFKLILQLESNTLYRGSKHEIVGSSSYLLFSILFFFLPLSILDYIFHFQLICFGCIHFSSTLGVLKSNVKEESLPPNAIVLTKNTNRSYQKKKRKKDLTALLHLHLFQWQLRQSVCGVRIKNKNGWWRIRSCNRYQSWDDILMRGNVAMWSCGNNNQQAWQQNDGFLCCLFTNNEQ